MSQRNKQLQSDGGGGKCCRTLPDCKARPVTEKDKWCQRITPVYRIPSEEAPWGYVVTIPFCPNNYKKLLDNLNGYIVLRTKKFKKNFLLQVVKTDYPTSYGIETFTRTARTAKGGKKRKIINVRNLSKTEGKW